MPSPASGLCVQRATAASEPSNEPEQGPQIAAAELGTDDCYVDLLDMDSASRIYAALRPRLERVMALLGAGYIRQPGRDQDYHDDEDTPVVEVSFDTAGGRGYRNELVFCVRGGCLEVLVRTWAKDSANDYQPAVVDGFRLVDDAAEPDEESLTAWAQAALKVAADHRTRLLDWVIG